MAHNIVVKEVQACDRPVRIRARWLLFYAHGPVVLVECDDTVPFGIANVIREDRRSLLARSGLSEELGQSVTEEDVVAQHHGHAIASDKVGADNKGFGKACGFGLLRITETNAPLAAVAE